MGRLGVPGASWPDGRTGRCIAMKKLCSFWKRKEEPHSPSSQRRVHPAGTRTFGDRGCNLRDKDLKKLHKAAAVGDLEKVKEYLQLKKYDVNIQDRKYR